MTTTTTTTTAAVTWADDWAQTCARMSRARGIADRVRALTMDRARAAAGDAFGGAPFWQGCIVHNAMVGRDSGRPWANVDYSALRRAVRLERRSFLAGRMADAYADRLMREVQARHRTA